MQVGNVAAAREALHDGADVLVAQGIDAGGHQFAAGAGIVSLVPEVKAMVEQEAKGREVAVVAAGGIANGSAVVSAIALGKKLPLLLLFRERNPFYQILLMCWTPCADEFGSNRIKKQVRTEL